MRGRIIKRGSGYTIVLQLGLDPTSGKRRQRWIAVDGNKHDAERMLAELLHEQATGTLVAPSKTTTGAYLTRWLSEYGKPHLSPRSYQRYAGIVAGHLLPAFGNVPLTDLRPEHIQKLYADLQSKGLAANSVHYDYTVLHGAIRMAMQWGLVGRNVADVVDPPNISHPEMQTWDEWEVAQFLEAAKSTPYYAVFFTNLYTGMRRSELLALAWHHVDFLYSQISVERGLDYVNGQYSYSPAKTKKSRRTIAMPSSLSLMLKEHRGRQQQDRLVTGKPLTEDDLVFSRRDGSPLFPNSVSRAWLLVAKQAGLKPIRFHDGRHTHATLMLKQGIHPKVVQERLGHSTIATTLDTYSHVVPGLQEAAAARFDSLMANKYNGQVAK